jgi:hypothetical protein
MQVETTSQERIGEFLVKIGAMTDAQRNTVLELQKQDPRKKFGQIALEMRFVNEGAIDTFIGHRL